MAGLSESAAQTIGAIRENSFELAPDQQFVHEKIKRNGIMNPVAHQGSAFAFFKSVFVPPEPVRTAHLFVHKKTRWLPHGDLASPAHWEAPNAQPVVDHRARVHLNRRRCRGPKPKPGRRDRVEVRGIGEKRENLFARPRNPEFGLEDSDAHSQIFRES